GSSAGGHLAALVGTSAGVASLEDNSMGAAGSSSGVQAVVDYYGPTDFLTMDDLPAVCEDPMVHLSSDSPESLLLGCDIRECPEKVKWANPITYITADDPPFLILHGTHDCTVTPESSVLLEKALKGKGVAAALHLLPGAGHGGPQFTSSETKSFVLDFLDGIFK
ncbi:MAG: alpha/beta hydrolase, partial [Bacteroidales bacterium]|nr:alpha/beta hydrolase [Bacteroidales bacterium]